MKTVRIEFRCSPGLRRALDLAAGAGPLNEYMARALAAHLGKPELGEIPRISWGRPRKKIRKNGR